MWMINCILLIIGSVAAVFGISFLIRNREATGNLCFYIFFYGMSSALWCISYGLLGLCDDLSICNAIRRCGIAGIDLFLGTELFLASEMCGVGRNIQKTLKLSAIVMAVLDLCIYGQSGVDLFIRKSGWTTWYANPAYHANRLFHAFFMLYYTLILFLCALAWVKLNKLKRLRNFFFMVFCSNFLLLFFSIPDFLFPVLGREAVSTSGIGGALCATVMWYGATQLSSFDIRMGNIRDRLLDFIKAGVIVFDMDRQIAFMNQYARQLASAAEPGRQGLSAFFELDEAMAETMFACSIQDIDTRRLWNPQKNKAYSVRMSAVKDNFDEPYCYLCVFVDVTEEVEAISKFKVASHAKSRFLAQMSHEIRTPINAVLGMNEMILRESKDKDVLEYAENIDSAGNTLLSLINSILDFSKIEDGKMALVPVTYDVASFINDLVHSIIQRAEAKGLRLELEIDPELPCALVGDDVRLSQIIMNLLTNAVKYTETGTVTLKIKTRYVVGNRVRIFVSVKDTGIGIKKEDLGRLFESFERLDEIRNHNIEGTGLGISIVTSLLDMMGSQLRVESNHGEGSVFYFTIEQEIANAAPIGDYEKRLQTSSSTRKQDDVIHAPGARILLVDDNAMNLKVARNLLKLCGIQPDMAASGAETIEAMRRKTYDIVFLDHMMPGMDGVDTLHELAKNQLVPACTTMIALTANAVVGAREFYLNAGFRDYLSKPIQIRELVEKLLTYLPESAYGEKEPDGQGDSMESAPKSDEIDSLEFVPDGAEDSLEFAPEIDAVDSLEFAPEIDTADSLEFAPDLPEDEVSGTGSASGIPSDADRLLSIGIDKAVGMQYCADDAEFYQEVLEEFFATLEDRLQTLDHLFHDRNWHEYDVLVHALKSNAKTIGALAVSEQARALEEAAHQEDAAFLEAHHGALLSDCRSMQQALGK